MVQKHKKKRNTNQRSLDSCLNSIKIKLKQDLDENLKQHTCLKVNYELFTIFLMFKNDTKLSKV